MLPLLLAMGAAADVPVVAQPAAFRTSAETPCFTKMPQFPDQLETIQIARDEFHAFGRAAAENAFGFVGGCCGCNAAYIRALAAGIGAA
jgi:betaine-homocysteine S-methyltransferase